MAKRVPSIDKTKYKTIGPFQYDVPGTADTARMIFVKKQGALKSVLEEFFESNPKPSDYDEDGEDLVFQDVTLEALSETIGRYTFLVGYVPVENIEPTTASGEGDAEPEIQR